MTDNRSIQQRRYNMQQIRSKNTKPEISVRKFLFSNGLRYRLHSSSLPGKPDIILKKYKTIIFIHGCFWHGHDDCKFAKKPVTNEQFWEEKISRNKIRDMKNVDLLKNLGWNIIVVWECGLSTKNKNNTFKEILIAITANLK